MSDADYGQWHTYSINEDPYGRKLRHGRAFATKFRPGHRDLHFGAEWRLLPKRSQSFGWGAKVTVGCAGDEHDLKLGLHASWLGDLWLNLAGFVPRRLKPKGYESKTIGATVAADRITYSLWIDEMGGKRDIPKWRYRYWDVPRLLFGKARYSTSELESGMCSIPMPEGTYAATYKVEQATWRYPRRPAKHVLTTTIDVVDGIPVPGKGENSWDIDDDAICGQTIVGRDVTNAIARLVETATKTRLRYGGSGWVPEPTK